MIDYELFGKVLIWVLLIVSINALVWYIVDYIQHWRCGQRLTWDNIVMPSLMYGLMIILCISVLVFVV